MSPSDDAPLLARLARGFEEWWFTARWRALLTWVALMGITDAVLYQYQRGSWLSRMTQLPIAYLNRLLPAPLPPVFNVIAFSLTATLLFTWFQPLALRLSLQRGLAWVGFPVIGGLMQFLSANSKYQGLWTWQALECGSAALQCWVLWGWRSRPWMCLPAWAAASALLMALLPLDLPYWLIAAVSELPKATLLLYGTRLLRPEERVQRKT